MQETSQLFKDIVAGENHWFETKVVIDGQTFGENRILSLRRERLGMSQNKPTVGGALSSTMTLTLLSEAAKGDVVDVSINTLPYKTTYADGEWVTAEKLEGLSVKVLYTSGEYEIVPYDGDIVHTNPDVPFVIRFGDSTTTSIDVGYTETPSTGQYYTWFTEFNVTKVDATVEYIELDVPVELLKFYVGEPFNINGLVVTAHYTNNTTADVTSECVYDPAVGTVLTEIGALNVTVSYTYRGTTVTDGFMTKVFEAPAYLTFSSPNSFTLATANTAKNWDGTLEYSQDAQNWNAWDGTIALLAAASGETYYLYLRGYGNTVITGSSLNRWALTGSAITCTGDIRTLLDYDTPESAVMASQCFRHMFFNCASLILPPRLPATVLANSCYESMFSECTSLMEAPKLPATTLADSCYSHMFGYCTSLVSAPSLPATTLAKSCYMSMFRGCKSLTSAPALPATTLADYCYQGFLRNCTALETAPALPAATLAKNCYSSMFNGCTSLTTMPDLPAHAILEGCYTAMFYGCVKIKLSTTQEGEYTKPYRIPTEGTGTAESLYANNMFSSTGGTFTGTPQINTTYYTSNAVIPAT